MLRCFFLFVTGLLFYPQDEPKIDEQLGVNLVELDVKVVNFAGDFVHGLGKTDIEVFENGTLQNLDKVEEISLRHLQENEEIAYRSRAMILLDFMNSNYQELYSNFKRLDEFFRLQYDQQSEIGIAVNSGSIQEMIPFTSDRNQLIEAVKKAQELYKNSRFKNFYNNETNLQSDSMSSYIRNEQSKLGQFIRYLGAFSGKKNLILVSSARNAISNETKQGEGAVKGQISIREIQTACLYNKISLSLLSMTSASDVASSELEGHTPFSLETRDDWGESMAVATAGSIARSSYNNFSDLLAAQIERGETYYRVRYYSSTKTNDYRNLSVKAKGLSRMAYSFAGYFPKKDPIKIVSNDETIQQTGPMSFKLRLPADWLQWEKTGFSTKHAFYTLSYRVYLATGRMVAEKVVGGEIKKKGKEEAIISTDFGLNMPSQKGNGRLEVRLIDMATGEVMLLEKAI